VDAIAASLALGTVIVTLGATAAGAAVRGAAADHLLAAGHRVDRVDGGRVGPMPQSMLSASPSRA
jgi:hypothetical protein